MPPTDVAGTVGKALLDVPLGDMIVSLGHAIADAQMSLDMNSLRTAQMMTGWYQPDGGKPGIDTKIKFDGEDLSLLELGFTPTFYQFVETTIEVKMSISMSTAREDSGFSLNVDSKADVSGSVGFFSASASASLHVSTVGAAYSSKFQYSAEGSSTIRTRLVPIPPPAILEERIRKSLDRKAAEKAGG